MKHPLGKSRSARTGIAELALLVFVLAVYAMLAARFNFLIDDAFISFRYAANWAEGAGLTYNRGTDPPVEGYSNFLWVAVLSLLERFDLPLETSSRVVSALCGAILLALLHRTLVRSLGYSLLSATAAALFLATSPCFSTWATGGLETMPFALLLFVLFMCCALPHRPFSHRRFWGAALCGLGLSLLRVEGLFWALGTVAIAAIARRGEPEMAFRSVLGYASAVVAGYALFVAFRKLHFGEWTANTVDAKTHLSAPVLLRGMKYLATFFCVFLSPAAVLLLSPIGLRKHGKCSVQTALGMVLGGFAFSVAVGGDWMPMFRFLLPTLPFLAWILAATLESFSAPKALAVAGFCVAAPLFSAADVPLIPRSLRERIYFRTFDAGYETELERWQRTVQNGATFAAIGQALRQVARPGESIVCGAIGAIGYYSGLKIYDRNGLVEPRVAALEPERAPGTAGHDRRVPRAFFLADRPTYLEARIAMGEAGAVLPSAARSLADQLAREGDLNTLHACIPLAFPVQQGGAIHGGTVLVVLCTEAEPARAIAAWRALGIDVEARSTAVQ